MLKNNKYFFLLKLKSNCLNNKYIIFSKTNLLVNNNENLITLKLNKNKINSIFSLNWINFIHNYYYIFLFNNINIFIKFKHSPHWRHSAGWLVAFRSKLKGWLKCCLVHSKAKISVGQLIFPLWVINYNLITMKLTKDIITRS